MTLGGSYHRKSRAHAYSNRIEYHGRAWKDMSHSDYIVY